MYYDGVVFKPHLDELYLEHHGVKGQKWGVEHGPPYPLGSEASTGKTIKKDAKPKKIEKSKLASKVKTTTNDDSKPKTIKHPITGKTIDVKKPSPQQLDNKLKQVTKNIKPDQKTVNLYKDAGMSDKDAEAAALRKKKIALAMGITAGVAVASIAGYAAYKHYTNPLRHDIRLKKGLEIQSVSSFADRFNAGDHIYAAIDKQDKARYIRDWGKNKYKITAKLEKSKKIASVKSSQKVFDDLYSSNKEFRDEVNARILHGNRDRQAIDILKSMTNEDKYLAFNAMLVDRNEELIFGGWNPVTKHQTVIGSKRTVPKAFTTYFSEMSKKGYSGIMDTNDLKGTKNSIEILANGVKKEGHGYRSNKPIILFDMADVAKAEVSKLTDIDFGKAAKTMDKYGNRVTLKDVADFTKQNPIPMTELAVSAACAPLVFSSLYDSSVTGKSSDELADIKYKNKKK